MTTKKEGMIPFPNFCQLKNWCNIMVNSRKMGRIPGFKYGEPVTKKCDEYEIKKIPNETNCK